MNKVTIIINNKLLINFFFNSFFYLKVWQTHKTKAKKDTNPVKGAVVGKKGKKVNPLKGAGVGKKGKKKPFWDENLIQTELI